MTGWLGARLAALKWWRPLEIGGSADPYLRRWFVLPRNRLANIYLHQFLRDDDDRALHDHPWPNLSLVLSRAGYREVVFARAPQHGAALPETAVLARRRWQVVGRRPKAAHRIVLQRDATGRPVPCWSLFLTGARLRDWGFWCPSGRWVHWRAFTAGPRGEVVGAGCGEAGYRMTLADEALLAERLKSDHAGRRIELPVRYATDEELRAQRESWVRGEIAIGLDREEAADRAAWVAAGRPALWPLR